MNNPQLAGQFVVSLVWNAIIATLVGDMGNSTDIDTIGEKDFDEEGMLTLNPPCVRIGFSDATFKPQENQNLNYWSEQEYFAICGDEDRGPDPQAQRNASLFLAAKVAHSLVGARLVLGDGTTTDPVEITGIRPIPTVDLGMAYVLGLKISGLALFPGIHKIPAIPQAGENNG